MIWYDEAKQGETIELGSWLFTEDDIIRFAKVFDPQPFHIDREAAKESHFRGIISSGWLTASIWMKLMVKWREAQPKKLDSNGKEAPGGPSPGFRDLKWIVPVRPGDTISYRSTTTTKRELASRPGWGLVEQHNEAKNQKGEIVMTFTSLKFMAIMNAKGG